jgi:LmbE family N-acetylglucosaminyl deacetylase
MPTAAVIVAHPDDETLWCGGFILQRPSWNWFVLSLCRASDVERAARFEQAMKYLGAEGVMADLDDGPMQEPLDISAVRHVIREAIPGRAFDFLLTHGPDGEYTQHRRHQECSQAVTSLWAEGHLKASRLMLFGYDDLNGTRLPQARTDADELYRLDSETLLRKHHIITQLYGFNQASWEARTTPAIEGFMCASSPDELGRLLSKSSKQIEG